MLPKRSIPQIKGIGKNTISDVSRNEYTWRLLLKFREWIEPLFHPKMKTNPERLNELDFRLKSKYSVSVNEISKGDFEKIRTDLEKMTAWLWMTLFRYFTEAALLMKEQSN